MTYDDPSATQVRIEAMTPVTTVEIVFSVVLIPAAIVLAAVIGWLAVRVDLYYLLLLAVPMALIALSCLGLRGLRTLVAN